MSKNLDELARMLLGKDNHVGITVGEVISTNPHRIKYGDKIILESRHLRFASALINGYKGEYEDTNGGDVEKKEVTVKSGLAVGNKVIMMPDKSMKNWYVLDKLVKL